MHFKYTFHEIHFTKIHKKHTLSEKTLFEKIHSDYMSQRSQVSMLAPIIGILHQYQDNCTTIMNFHHPHLGIVLVVTQSIDELQK